MNKYSFRSILDNFPEKFSTSSKNNNKNINNNKNNNLKNTPNLGRCINNINLKGENYDGNDKEVDKKERSSK
jgi:hypothetical protein